MRGLIAGLVVVGWVAGPAFARPPEGVPPAFQPFEHMIGGWKGTAKPASNPLKGWQESHGWAWKFEGGKPIGLAITFEGDKTLAKGAIGFDASTKRYKLDGVDPAGKPVAFLGALSPDGKTLTFDRLGATPEGKERIIIRPNSNKIRYTFQVERQEPGAPQFKGLIAVGLTKDGESFAAGAGGADLPKCIMTGGAAGITVTYLGKSYPVCCTGCRDEFNDNPEKYAKIADLAAQAGPARTTSAGPPASKGKDDGSFDGLIDEPKVKKEATPSKAVPKPKDDKPTADPTDAAKAKDAAATVADRLLKLGQDSEKRGQKATALGHYRKVVKDFPGTEPARTAEARIKALEAR